MTNEELSAKRAEQPALTAGPVGDEVAAVLARLKETVKASPPTGEPTHRQVQDEIRLRELRLSWNVPKRHFEQSDIDRAKEWGAVEKHVLSKIGQGYLLALVGVRGAGKTQIGVEIARETTKRLRSALYCTAMEFFLDIKSTYRKDAARSEKEVVKDYTKPFLLIIDEFAKRGETEWENRLLFHLLDQRYQDYKDTLLIVNQEKKEFTEMIGPSLASRMQETGGTIECNWKSYRTKE